MDIETLNKANEIQRELNNLDTLLRALTTPESEILVTADKDSQYVPDSIEVSVKECIRNLCETKRKELLDKFKKL